MTWLLAAALLLPASLREALDQYDFGEFDKACATLDRLKTDPSFDTEARLKTLKYLGACRHALQDEPSARAAWTSLLDADPRANLDPVQFPPDMVAFFGAIKQSHAAKPEPKPPAVGPPRVVETVPPKRPAKSKAKAWLPFGVGQFQNGQDTKGYWLAGFQGVTLAAGVGGLVLFESKKRSGGFLSGGEFDDPDEAETLQTLYVAGFVGFAALYAYGVFDALANFDEPAVTVLPTPEGLIIGGRW